MPSFTVVTFGCQMNQHDSERMQEVLRGAGYAEVATPDMADIVLLNTCSVREKAEQKLRSEVGRIAMLKRSRPDMVIGVAGCVAQQEGEALLKGMPDVDLIIGPDNIPELPALLSEVERGSPPQVRTVFDVAEPRFLSAAPTPGSQGPTAFVTTMKGCDERCTYCIVPHTRGPERYRPSTEIVEEIGRLVAAGAREVTLLGQTVDSYRDPLRLLQLAPRVESSRLGAFGKRTPIEDESEFPALLRQIAAQVPALQRLRYTSPHPRHLTAALIAAHRDLPVLALHVHMPMQSGSDAVLKRMVRRYTRAEYVERVSLLRETVPGLTVSTDIIVGFPGETEADFQATLSAVREIGFIGVFGFKYSPRPYTPALKLGDDIPEVEKARRLEALFELSEGLRREHLQTLVGGVESVLIEGRSKGGAFTGRTLRNEIVHLDCTDDPTGEIVDVRIDTAFKHSLAGTLLDARRAKPLARAQRDRTGADHAVLSSPVAAPLGPRSLPVVG
jgi:tRNA-2-methylthio-N6-dimethylallyladenosine synthase